ncbi:hypothetical protein [Loigolactobacillus backii]|uniref:Uncharacterized protein n=1 Tax=Loigolactobacillus backii TaxID=375175 RepID=A0A192GY37_9LACO|nr:hypothetical protein [Loigolactobacillus backii]ANK61429.1 hypothetical protein AYR53_00845 [Loigolactobacillus backii]ANK69371.1 hypothetical protein AYR56_03870 [Loigolactobacillus backii]MDA5387770.1 hypothetical protein [Loigolactobacillus backii]MDA5390939.1 hypothetical protein [Loigolactobacillus backii]PIO84179.1 hypothetical protein BSQ39_11710 [Loigolactobacillus backii]
MTALEISGRTYSELPIPDDYQLVYDRIVTRDGEKIHLRRYQPADLKEEALERERVVVLCRDDGYVLTYNALIHPGTGKLPSEKEAWAKAERVWQEVDPKYRERLERMETSRQERSYVNAAGKTITVPIIWAKYADLQSEGNYCWVGLGANNEVLEFERDSYWDYDAARQKSEMWNYDDWILARRGDGPQLDPPRALA